jgi:hypothetical protein
MAGDSRSTAALTTLRAPVEVFRSLLREQYPERPVLADEIQSEEWFLERQQGEPLQEGTAQAREFVAAVEALNTFYRRVRKFETPLRGIDENGVERDLGPIEQETGVDLNIWKCVFDCRSLDFSFDDLGHHVGHLYRNVRCYADPEPLAAQPDEPVPAVSEESPTVLPGEAAIADSAQAVPEAESEESSRGPPEQYDWDEGFRHVRKLWAELGDPRLPENAKDGWRADADVGRAVQEYVRKPDPEEPGSFKEPDFKHTMNCIHPLLKELRGAHKGV